MDSFKSKIFPILNKVKKKLALSFSFLKNIFFVFKKEKSHNKIQDDLDKKLVHSLSKSKFPNFSQFKYIGKFLDPKEILIIKTLFVFIFLNLVVLGWQFYKNNVYNVPVVGGTYSEALIGSPQHINPIYSGVNDVDSDIGVLIFSSLFKHTNGGDLEKDLVEDFKISEDGREYTVVVKENVKWHTGDYLTVDDIIFTFNVIKDKQYDSTLRSSFLGVLIEKVDGKTVKFILEEPYAAFLELLDFGIIPQNLWLYIMPESARLAELNLKPIGSGPYKFKKLIKDRSGAIKEYVLEINYDYYGKKPFLEELSFRFFVSFEEAMSALNDNSVDGISYLPRYLAQEVIAKDSLNFYNLKLPQITAVFFNQTSNEFLKDKKIRQALAFGVDKNKILNNLFNGDVDLVHSPILADTFAYKEDIKKYDFNFEEAKKLLEDAKLGLKEITEAQVLEAEENIKATTTDEEDILKAKEIIEMEAGKWLSKDDKYFKIVLTTVESDDNINVVESLKEDWEKLGVKVVLNIISPLDIQSGVLRSREFEALFYGQVVGFDPDSYVFWHSSQTGENGLNISGYTNKEVDKLLEDARLSTDQEKRIENYKKFQEILASDVPAIFMYSPVYAYAQSKKIKNFSVEKILKSSDRFSNINDWYIKTGKEVDWKGIWK